MRRNAALLIAILIAIIVVTIAVYARYSLSGWEIFECASESPCSWTSTGAKGVVDLRFKSAIFTVTLPDGTVYTKDVSPALEGMAAGYRDVPNNGILTLVRPLNPFSFVIAGVNDAAAITSPNIPAAWKNATATLRGKWRVL